MGVQHSSALHQQLRATTMGQIMLGKHHKESVGSVAELLPTINPGIQERRLDVSPKRSSSSLASTILVILSIIFAVSALKQICDLREQNLSLMQQLAYERQKDAALKLAVRHNIPADKFMQQRFSSAENEKVEAEGKVEEPRSSWSINLSVLWTSPSITPCDMSRLAQVLAQEIYQIQEEQDMAKEENENKENGDQIKLTTMNKSNEEEENNDSDEIYDSVENSSEEFSSNESGFLKMASDEDLELDYFLQDAPIWDDSEEYNLLGEDSEEQEYYNYYSVGDDIDYKTVYSLVMQDMKSKFDAKELTDEQKVEATKVITETQKKLGDTSLAVLGLERGEKSQSEVLAVLSAYKQAGNMTEDQNNQVKK